MENIRLIERLNDNFYGFISPSGEFIGVSEKEKNSRNPHERLARRILGVKAKDYDPEEPEINKIELMKLGYIAVHNDGGFKEIQYLEQNFQTELVDEKREILINQGWIIIGPYYKQVDNYADLWRNHGEDRL